MEDKKDKKNKVIVDFIINHWLIMSICSILFGFAGIPFSIHHFIINNDWYSKAGNDGWASFWGSYLGGIFGGIGTLIAVMITTRQSKNHQIQNLSETRRLQEENLKQTREIQEDNKNENKRINEIDSLKMQIEYSKNTFRLAYEYQSFLDNIDVEIDIILRRTNFLSRKNTDVNEVDLSKIKFKDEYEAMKKQEEILSNLDIEAKMTKLFSKMEEYSKLLIIESSSIINEDINLCVSDIFEKLFDNTKSISEIIRENKNIDEAKKMLHGKDSEVNSTVELLIVFQIQLKEYIESCQSRINQLIYYDVKKK